MLSGNYYIITPVKFNENNSRKPRDFGLYIFLK